MKALRGRLKALEQVARGRFRLPLIWVRPGQTCEDAEAANGGKPHGGFFKWKEAQ
jgi:hypothetical protein